jgi:hypothetical protein
MYKQRLLPSCPSRPMSRVPRPRIIAGHLGTTPQLDGRPTSLTLHKRTHMTALKRFDSGRQSMLWLQNRTKIKSSVSSGKSMPPI